MRALIVNGLVIVIAGCATNPPAYSRSELAHSEAVKVLKADDSPYRIIYNPPEDLAKQPAPVISGPSSPRRE